MKLKQLLEQLNQLAKERPEALEMEVYNNKDNCKFITNPSYGTKLINQNRIINLRSQIPNYALTNKQ